LGAKLTVAIVLCPGASVIGMFGGAMEKAVPFAATSVTVMLELPAGEEFSRVRLISLLLPIVTFPKSSVEVLKPRVPFCLGVVVFCAMPPPHDTVRIAAANGIASDSSLLLRGARLNILSEIMDEDNSV
jgi:hypothetical protein